MLTSSGGSLNAGRGVKFAKILLTSYVNAPLSRFTVYIHIFFMDIKSQL